MITKSGRGLVGLVTVTLAACAVANAPSPSAPGSVAATPSSFEVATATPRQPPVTTPTAAIQSWTSGPSLREARADHTATVLLDGRVLVAGGRRPAADGTSDQVLASAEIFDPTAGSWTSIAPMRVARYGHSATLLADGSIVVIGGRTSSASGLDATAERFDPASGAWAALPKLPIAPGYHSATGLPDGRLLVIGDRQAGVSADFVRRAPAVEVFDPRTTAWTVLSSRGALAGCHTATLLDDGLVLVEGGCELTELPSPLPHAALFDPGQDRWTALPDMSEASIVHASARRGDGSVIVIGSAPVRAELYTPASRSWTRISAPVLSGISVIARSLPGGSILAIGDGGGGGTARAELLHDVDWADAGTIPVDSGFAAVVLLDGRVLVIGGRQACGPGACANPSTAETFVLDALLID